LGRLRDYVIRNSPVGTRDGGRVEARETNGTKIMIARINAVERVINELIAFNRFT